MFEHAAVAGFDLGVISGTVRQLKLYRHMGFIEFGPLVGTPEAPYQPMYITQQQFEGTAAPAFRARAGTLSLVAAGDAGNFLPGPVVVHPDVWEAFTRTPVSHRHPAFAADLAITRDALRALTGARHVQLLVGGGTLANDAIAAQIALLDAPGVVLANGEFGDRLADHARRARLAHRVVGIPWGSAFDPTVVERAISALPPGGWCWMVHCETSTGVLNDLDAVRALCVARGVRLCADCVSSIGAVPVDLRDVHLASGVSGKALAGLSGMSMVFHHDPVVPDDRLPRYVDLGYAAARGGVPFTQSSNLLAALRVAAERALARAPFGDVAVLGRRLRAQLRERGFTIVAPEAHAAPAVVTLAIPGEGNGARLGERLAAAGFELNFRSDYLRSRDWVQVALMGEGSAARLPPPP